MTENVASAAEPPGFTLSVSDAGGGKRVVAAAGELDIVGAAQLLRAVAVLRRPVTSAVAIDLSALTFIDSSGINALRSAVRAANARGVGAIVAAPSQRVERVLELVKLADILPLEHSLADAFQRLDSDGSPEPRKA